MPVRVFEHCIWKARLFVLIAVIASMVAAILMVFLGALSVFWELSHFSVIFTSPEALEAAHKSLTIHAISAMDTFLIATVLFIFSIGLYDLFVRKIDIKGSDNSPELVVSSLEQLKEKLLKVILIVLVVTFFKAAISLTYKTPVDLLYLALAVLLIAGSLALSHFKKKCNNSALVH